VKILYATNSPLPIFVDDEDYERVSVFAWRIGNNGYVQRTDNSTKPPSFMLMHRFVMHAKNGEEVDHENRNKLDNQKDNLRGCTHVKNCAWRGLAKRKWSTSRFKGVDFNKHKGRWFSRITVAGQFHWLGMHDSEEAAAAAYDAAAKRLNGEYAGTNESIFKCASY